MLQLRPNCECCNTDLAGDASDAYICSFECTFCARCTSEKLQGKCPNCGGELVRRPPRAADKLLKYPASTERVYKPEGCGSALPETALICRVPEAERYIAHHRQRFDPSARRNVPAHVTILYPFMAPPLVDDEVIATLAGIARSVPCFNYRLAKTRAVSRRAVPGAGTRRTVLRAHRRHFSRVSRLPAFRRQVRDGGAARHGRTRRRAVAVRDRSGAAHRTAGRGCAGALLRTGAHRELERPLGADARVRARRVNSARANRDHRAAARAGCLPALHRSVWRALGRFWRGTVTPWLAEHGMLDCPRYGVTLDNPMNTPPEKCRYDACVELPRDMTLPDAGETTIAGGRYAVTHFKGTGAEIGAAWGAFVGAALGDSANRRDPARHRSSTIRAARHSIRRPACSPASCACPSSAERMVVSSDAGAACDGRRWRIC